MSDLNHTEKNEKTPPFHVVMSAAYKIPFDSRLSRLKIIFRASYPTREPSSNIDDERSKQDIIPAPTKDL